MIGSLLLLNGWYMRYRLGTEMSKAFASPARTGQQATINAAVRHLPIEDQQVIEFNADIVMPLTIFPKEVVKIYLISVVFIDCWNENERAALD